MKIASCKTFLTVFSMEGGGYEGFVISIIEKFSIGL